MIRFRIPRERLVAALKTAAIPARRVGNSTSVLAFVHVEATTDGRVWLSSIAFDVSVRVLIDDVDVMTAGSVCIIGAAWERVVSACPAGSVLQIAVDAESSKEGRVRVECGRSVNKLATVDVREFPPLQFDDDLRPVVTMPSAILSRILSVCAPFVSDNSSRPGICGVQIEIGHDETIGVATDSVQLARCSVEWGVESVRRGRFLTVFAPSDLVPLVESAIDRTGADCELSRAGDDQTMIMTVGDTSIGFRVIDDKFPDWRRVIPDLPCEFVHFNRSAWLAPLQRLAAFADGERAVRFRLRSDGLEMLTVTQSTEIGCEGVDGVEGLARPLFHVDARRLLAALRSFNGDDLRLHVIGASLPFVLVSPEDPAVLQVLSPMMSDRLKGWPE